MSDDDKILFLENLLAIASKTLKKFKQADKFYLCEDNVYAGFCHIATNSAFLCKVDLDSCKVDLDNDSHFNFTIDLHLSKTLASEKHSLKKVFSKWKKAKNEVAKSILLQIINKMEEEVASGWTLGMKLPTGSEVPGIVLWHANVAIEQLAVELDMMA